MDLPAPLGPTSATRRPGPRSRSSPSSASGPSGSYRTCTPRSRTRTGPAGSGRGATGSATGSGASRTAPIRSAEPRESPSWRAAAGRAVTASKAASAVRVTTASGTRVSVPPATAATPRNRTPHRVRPETATMSPLPRPAAAAERRASDVSCRSAAATAARPASWAPNACSSAAPDSRSVMVAPRSPRAGAVTRAARRDAATARAGTATPAVSSPRASTPPAGARMNRHAVTAPAPTSAAASGGPTPRMNRSWVASTSLIRRASRSPERKAASPAGASRSSRR